MKKIQIGVWPNSKIGHSLRIWPFAHFGHYLIRTEVDVPVEYNL